MQLLYTDKTKVILVLSSFIIHHYYSFPVQAVVPSSPFALACRGFQTSSQVQDVDSAAKFIGAGAATVGVAGL